MDGEPLRPDGRVDGRARGRHRLRAAPAHPHPRPTWPPACPSSTPPSGRPSPRAARSCSPARRCSSRCWACAWRACRPTRRSASPPPSPSSRSWSAPSCWCPPSAACCTVGCCRGGCAAVLRADVRQGPTRSERWANRVAARPLAWALAAVTVMLLLAAPVLDMRTWPQSGSDDPTSMPGPPDLRPADRRVRARRARRRTWWSPTARVLTDAEVATVVADLRARDDLVNVDRPGGLARRGSGGGERGVDVRRQRRPHSGPGGLACAPSCPRARSWPAPTRCSRTSPASWPRRSGW